MNNNRIKSLHKALFTKKLKAFQKQRSTCQIDDFDFITINELTNTLPSPSAKHVLFTSQNAVHFFFKHNKLAATQSIYAVGEKTKKAILENGDFQNLKTPSKEANTNALIALLEKEKLNDFLYICGRNRLPYLEDYFKKSGKQYRVVEMYETILSPVSNIEIEAYEYLCFCSPSAVKSYVDLYPILDKHKVLCIGKTTENYLKNYTQNIEVAEQATVESMLAFLNRKYTL